ncbi:hypothetical protein I3843_04G127300 [Carya illinoinensis]|nr:hypothetical protein I3843_04G127300 [Carya illinoinensis]
MICSSWACTVAAVGKVDPGAQDGFISVGEVEASTISCDGANGGGRGETEAFPNLGKHCQQPDCHQLNFLPFKCDGCRKVIVCENCLMSIETTRRDGEDENVMLERHEKSGNCDPKKKNKSTCHVMQTLSNTRMWVFSPYLNRICCGFVVWLVRKWRKKGI